MFFALSDYWMIYFNCGSISTWIPASVRTLSVSQVKQQEALYSEGVLCLPAHTLIWTETALFFKPLICCNSVFLLLSLQETLLGQGICADTAAVVSVNWKSSNKRRTWLGKQFFDWDESIASNKIFFGMIPVFFCRLAELIVSYLWPKNCFSKTSLLSRFVHRRNGRLSFSCMHWEQMFMDFFHSPPYSFCCSFSWKPKTNRFSNSTLSKTYYNHYQVAVSTSSIKYQTWCFLLDLVCFIPQKKSKLQNLMCRDKACCWSRENLCRESFVGLRKLGFCRLWNFLGNPSQRSEVEWATNGVCCHLNLLFFKRGTQAVVSSSADSSELSPLLPPHYNPNVPIFYL